MDRFESVFRIFDRLAQLERHYEVARTPTGGVRAERTATTPATWPDSITLSLSSTGAVAKIDLVFPPLPGGFGAPSLDRVHYTLVEELPLIDAYFRHDAHHAEDRPVRYVK